MNHDQSCSFLTGIGQTDTRKHTAGGRYTEGNWQDLWNAASNPVTVDKGAAPWAIFSDANGQLGRDLAYQKEHGYFTALWADIDKGDPTLAQVAAAVRAVLGAGVAFLVYNSVSNGGIRSEPDFDTDWGTGWSAQAGSVKMKYRVVVPMATFLPAREYKPCAASFNIALQHQGLIPDKVTETVTQLCYLPNRGPVYDPPHMEAGGLLDLQSNGPLKQIILEETAKEQARQVERDERAAAFASNGKNETSRSVLKAFREKHPTESLLALYGFTSKNGGEDWHWDQQSGDSYATELFPDGGMHTRSATVGAMGVEAGNSGWNLDGFDLYKSITCKGDHAQAMAYALLCRQEADKARLGDATSGGRVTEVMDEVTGEIETGFLPWPDRAYGNGYDLAQAWFAQLEAERLESIAAAERLQQEEKEFVEALHKVEANAKAGSANAFDGPWRNEVPFDVPANALEWAAWHAPGLLGEIVRGKAPHAKRRSLVPLMLGAISGINFLAQGKIVSSWNEHMTPTAMMCFLVGESGSGKSDSVSTFKDVLRMGKRPDDQPDHHAHLMREFASGPAVTDFMSGGVDKEGNAKAPRPNVFVLQNEGGAKRSAGTGDKHQEGVMAETTDLFTAFEDGTEGGHGKTSGTSGGVKNPTFGALMSSTPEKLFKTIGAADAESGWLGRYLFIEVPATLSIYDRGHRAYSAGVQRELKNLGMLNPPEHKPSEANPMIWRGDEGSFHIRQYSAETTEFLLQTLRTYDEMAIDKRRSMPERAVYARSTETINRLTLCAAVAMYPTNTCPKSAAEWAKVVVDASVEFVTRKMDNLSENEADSFSTKVRNSTIKMFKRAANDEAWRKKSFGTSQKKSEAGEVQLTLSALRKKLASYQFSGYSSTVRNLELEAMVNDGILKDCGKDDKSRHWYALNMYY